MQRDVFASARSLGAARSGWLLLRRGLNIEFPVELNWMLTLNYLQVSQKNISANFEIQQISQISRQ